MNIKEFADFYNNIKVDYYINDDKKREKAIYHYTSPTGFAGIIENNTLRFTDRFYLNDKSEGIYVLKLCVDNIETLDFRTDDFRESFLRNCRERISQPQRDRFYIYQCSFSTDKDSLCLWNYYTKLDGIKGYNLKFDASNLSKSICVTKHEGLNAPILRYGKVIYDKEKQLEILHEIVRLFCDYSLKNEISTYDFMSSFLIDKIMLLGVFFKMPCFNVENEFRLFYDLHLNEDNTYSAIKDKQHFYERNGIFIPYVDLHFDKDSLIGVGVSPTLDFEATRESILRITGTKYSNVNKNTIYQSKIPVRY